jgi:hypothetical protein
MGDRRAVSLISIAPLPGAGIAPKSTIYKLQLQLAGIDRGVYGEHSSTLARHPSGLTSGW